jgi:hypothetical protein
MSFPDGVLQRRVTPEIQAVGTASIAEQMTHDPALPFGRGQMQRRSAVIVGLIGIDPTGDVAAQGKTV